MRTRVFLLVFSGVLVLASANAQSASNPAVGVKWMLFQDALSEAQATSTKLLVDVYAPWCGWCSRLQEEVYTNETVQGYLKKHYTVTRLNIDDLDDKLDFKGYELSSAELAMGLGASGTPTTVFINSDGDYITRLPGFIAAQDFLTVLQFVATNAYLSQSFEEFADLQ